MPRKNGTLTSREQAKALANIEREIWAISDALVRFTGALEVGVPVSDAMSTAWNALHDAETALRAEHRRVSLNTPQSAIDRMMANVD